MKKTFANFGNLTSLSLLGKKPFESFTKNNADLERLSREFESILVSQMMKSIREGMPSEGLIKRGFGEEVFTGMLDDEYAKSFPGNNSNSLWRTLYRQLSEKKSK